MGKSHHAALFFTSKTTCPYGHGVEETEVEQSCFKSFTGLGFTRGYYYTFGCGGSLGAHGKLCKYGFDSSGKVEMETKYTTLETNKVIDIALSLKNRLENMIIPIDKMALRQNGF